VKYTLLSDGSSDRALRPVLDWALRQEGVAVIQAEWADFRHLRTPPADLTERILMAVQLYQCDCLFVHRDAEGEPQANRLREIQVAWQESGIRGSDPVRVVPVRMTEAWLLHDEAAIRRAAGNPGGQIPLELPRLRSLEDLADPKEVLRKLLVQASELPRRRRFDPSAAIHRVADYIGDYSTLDRLRGFSEFRLELKQALDAQPNLRKS
jgi:hypothetical protein